MAYYGGSIRSPIVISDEDEDAALVDLQLWSDVRHPSTSSQGSEKYQSLRGDERRGSWASNVDELNGTDSYGLDMMPGWSSNDVVDNHAGTPLTMVSVYTMLRGYQSVRRLGRNVSVASQFKHHQLLLQQKGKRKGRKSYRPLRREHKCLITLCRSVDRHFQHLCRHCSSGLGLLSIRMNPPWV